MLQVMVKYCAAYSPGCSNCDASACSSECFIACVAESYSRHTWNVPLLRQDKRHQQTDCPAVSGLLELAFQLGLNSPACGNSGLGPSYIVLGPELNVFWSSCSYHFVFSPCEATALSIFTRPAEHAELERSRLHFYNMSRR